MRHQQLKMHRTKLLNLNQFKNIVMSRSVNSNPPKLMKLEKGSQITVTRQVTENDVTRFATLTDDFNPIHIKRDRKIVHGALLNGFLSGVLGTKLPGPGIIVVHQDLYYPQSCYPGDILTISIKMIETRKIITCSYEIIANSERIVLQGTGRFVMSKPKL